MHTLVMYMSKLDSGSYLNNDKFCMQRRYCNHDSAD